MADPTLLITPNVLDATRYYSFHTLTADWSTTSPRPPIGWPIGIVATISLLEQSGFRVHDILPTTNPPKVAMPADFKPTFNLLLWHSEIGKPSFMYNWKTSTTLSYGAVIYCRMIPDGWINPVVAGQITISPTISGMMIQPTPPTGVLP